MMKKSLQCMLFLAGSALLRGGISQTASAAGQNWNPALQPVQSCAQVDAYLQSALDTYWSQQYFGPLAKDGAIVNSPATKESVSMDGGMGGGGGGADFSQTNVQKDTVDEPDIIKNTGKYIYYVDQNEKTNKSDIRVVEVATQKLVYTVTLPKQMWASNLLYQQGKLVVLGSVQVNRPSAYYDTARYVYRDQKVAVFIYDLKNPARPSLVQGYMYDGRLQEGRIVDGNVIMTIQNTMSRNPVYRAVWDMLEKNTTKQLKKEQFRVTAKDVLPTMTAISYKVLTPKTGKPRMVEQKTIQPLDCSQILLPQKQPDTTAKNMYRYAFGEGMTSIVSLSLTNPTQKPFAKIAFANNAQIHVSAKSIYLTSPVYMPAQYACPAQEGVMCMPWIDGSSYTVLHKFALQDLSYTYASVVEGSLYNQYSMDENADGVMRVVTSEWKNNKNRNHVYTIQQDGKVAGSIKNIAPGESYYGVRFIDDYLYLVTYKQIDPLFVIDLKNPTKPVIVGELKMPGYSNYLHPYAPMKDGVQYLIGLGYETTTNAEGWEQQKGIKIDLYKVDFTKKTAAGKVPVTQVRTKVLGDEQSQTEALYNPRMFVYNQAKKELMLPIALTKMQSTKTCYTTYDEQGNVIKNNCDDPNAQTEKRLMPTFIGLKVWSLNETGLTEKISVDYTSYISERISQQNKILGEGYYGYTTDPMHPIRQFSSFASRVGYNGDTYYMFTSAFAQFVTTTGTGQMISFDTSK